MMHRFIKPLSGVIISSLVTLALIEIGLRLTGIVATSALTQPVNPEAPYIHLKPDHTFTFARGWDGKLLRKHSTNEYGYNTTIQFTDYKESVKKVALIGDSYIEAFQVHPSESLGSQLHNNSDYDVLPIGISGSPLSQYEAFAQFATKQFKPDKLIFLIIDNDFDESLLKYKNAPGYHYYDSQDDMQSVLIDWQPRPIMRLLQKSYFVQYLINNLQVLAIIHRIRYASTDTVNTQDFSKNDVRIEESKHAVDQFLNSITTLGYDSKDILIITDAERLSIYADKERDPNMYKVAMMKYMVDAATSRNLAVLDLHSAFVEHYKNNSSPFNFSFDYHWNELGHNLAAETVLLSGFLD